MGSILAISAGSSWCDMTESVHTQFESSEPWILLEMCDGRFESVQFSWEADHEHDEEFLSILRSALTNCLAQHNADVLESLRTRYAAPADPDREAAMAFAQQILDEATDVIPESRTWFPERADGRDKSGAVHVSVIRSAVVRLDVPFDMLQDSQLCGWAIRDALNQALERHDKDVIEFGIRRNGGQQPTIEPAAPNWAMLAKQANRLRNGWC